MVQKLILDAAGYPTTQSVPIAFKIGELLSWTKF
jgi:hypothetical protein